MSTKNWFQLVTPQVSFRTKLVPIGYRKKARPPDVFVLDGRCQTVLRRATLGNVKQTVSLLLIQWLQVEWQSIDAT